MKIEKVAFMKEVMVPPRGVKAGLNEKEPGSKDADISFVDGGFVQVLIEGQKPLMIPRENVASFTCKPEEPKKK